MIATHRASASKVAEMFSCGYWARPDVELAPDETGPAARVGNAIDLLTTAFVDGEVLSAQEAARQAKAEESPVVERWSHLLPWLSNNVTGAWAPQLWLVWDAATDTTRATTRERAKKEGRGPLEISAVIDLVSQTGPDEVTLWDIKSGKVAGAKVEQLLTNAVAARRHYGVNRARVGFVFAHTDKCFPVKYEPTPEDLDAHAAKLHAYMLEVPEAQPTPGDACRFCRVVSCAPGDEYRRKMRWVR